MEDINNWRPNVIVLGPGGAKGYLELGALMKLKEAGYTDKVTQWIGCSIGSGIALMIVCGYTPEAITKDFMDFNILDDIINIDFSQILTKAGLIEMKSLERLLEIRVQQSFGFIPTLKQLYLATGLIYVSVTYNTDKLRVEYLDKNTEPDLLCVEATMMSMAMPIFICPRTYKGSQYIDGAVGDPYPVLIYDNGLNDILGIYINSENPGSNPSIPPILYKAYQVIQGTIKRLRDQNITWSSDKVKHLELKTQIIDSIGITINIEERKKMIQDGYRGATRFLDKLNNPNKYKLLLEDGEEIPTVEDLLSRGIILEGMIDLLDSVEPIFESTSNGSSDSDDILYIPLTKQMEENLSIKRW